MKERHSRDVGELYKALASSDIMDFLECTGFLIENIDIKDYKLEYIDKY